MTDQRSTTRAGVRTQPAQAALAARLGLAAGDQVVAVWPHPDDEAWAAAWTLRGLADAGVRVRLVFATDGEAAAGADADGATSAGLRALRRAEAEAAATLLGCEQVHFLDRGDGRLAEDAGLKAALAEVLAEAADCGGVVAAFSFGPDGGYPHRDHVALTAALAAAVRAGGPHLWWQTCFAPGIFAPVLRALGRRDARGRAPPLLDADWPPPRLGAAAAGGDVCVHGEGDSARAFKTQVIACHASQLPGGDPLRLLGPGVVEAALAHGERWRRATTATASRAPNGEAGA